MPRGRKVCVSAVTSNSQKLKTAEEDYPTYETKFKLDHKAFDLVKNVSVHRDSSILEQFGVPLPPDFLNVNLGSKPDQFNLVLQTFSKYADYLLETIEKCQDERFTKRRIMFIKLVKAIKLKFMCAFRWKYFDRMLLKSVGRSQNMLIQVDRNSFRSNYNIQKVKEYLQIYQTLWEEHCKSMQRLLAERNETQTMLKVYELENSEESNISSVMSKLNELVQDCERNNSDTSTEDDSKTKERDPKPGQTQLGGERGCPRELFTDVPCDEKYRESLDVMKDKIQNLKFTRTNQLQSMVNRAIGKYQHLVDTVENYNDTLVKLSNMISEKMFKKMTVKEYVKLIQVIISSLKIKNETFLTPFRRKCLIPVRFSLFEMVKKFTADDIISQNLVKTSVQRSIKSSIISQYPALKDTIDVIFPKKTPMYLAKCQDRLSLLMVNGEIIFIQQRDIPWIPSLRLLHKYPSILPKMQIDSGAIKFILRGSNIMCPGLTSEGGKMEDVEVDTIVQVTASGRYNACAIGIMTMSTKEIIEKNRDVCIQTLHYLNDGFWQFDSDKFGHKPS